MDPQYLLEPGEIPAKALSAASSGSEGDNVTGATAIPVAAPGDATFHLYRVTAPEFVSPAGKDKKQETPLVARTGEGPGKQRSHRR
jgi:hypothetical protein